MRIWPATAIGASPRTLPRGVALACALLLLAAPARADILRGTVRDSLGQPVFNADFDVFTTDGVLLTADDNTDADGSYEILVPPGRYDIVCEPVPLSGLAATIRRGVDVAAETRLDWVLPAGYRVLGRVLGPGGPVAGVDLDFDHVDDGRRQPATGDITSLFGTFATYIAAGAYRVSLFPPEASGLAPAVIPFMSIPTSDTLNVALVPAARLTGFATVAGGGVAADARLTMVEYLTGSRVPILGNRTDGAGGYRVSVAPGVYRLRVTPARGNGLVPLETGAIDLAADVQASFVLSRGPTVSGTVLDRAGRPLAGADWNVFDAASGTLLYTGDDDTDEAGRYALSLPAGVYRFMLTPPPGSALDTLEFDALAVTADRALDVNYSRLGGAPGVGLAIAPAVNPSRLGGGVLLSLSEAGAVRVDLFDAAGRRVRRLVNDWLDPGVHALAWDGRNQAGTRVGAGVFFLRVQQGARQATKRWVVLP